MSLQEKVTQIMKEAMRAKDKLRLEAVRAIKSELLLAKTSGGDGEMNEEAEIKILQKLVKQRRDSAEIYKQQARAELADNELAQANIIEEFLPAQLSDDELEAALKEVIDSLGASSMKDMGKVMGTANAKLKGKADGKRIAEFVKKALS